MSRDGGREEEREMTGESGDPGWTTGWNGQEPRPVSVLSFALLPV